MTLPAQERAAWLRVKRGLAFARRGTVLLASSGMLILCVGAVGRAGCSDPELPEIRSLLSFQDLIFHAGLWLGFCAVAGGLLWTAFMPGVRVDRVISLGAGALAGLALLLACLMATPGVLPPVNAPPAQAGSLMAAVVGTAAVASSALVAMQVTRRLAAPALRRGSLALAPAILGVAAANAEAASGLVFSDPLVALYALGVIATFNAVVCVFLLRLIRAAEDLIRQHLAGD